MFVQFRNETCSFLRFKSVRENDSVFVSDFSSSFFPMTNDRTEGEGEGVGLYLCASFIPIASWEKRTCTSPVHC